MAPSTAAPTLQPTYYPSTSPSTVFIISTVAGSSTSPDYSGDGGQATSAGLNYPTGARLDAAGNQLLIHLNIYFLLRLPSPPRQYLHR